MLHAGLDLSRRKLDVCLLSDDGEHLDQLVVPPDAGSLRTLARRIDDVHGEPVCAVIESMTGARIVHDTLEQEGWSVEIAVPWKALGELARRDTPPRAGDQWRMNFTRVATALRVENGRYRKIEGRASQVSSWSPQYVMDIHRPETWGYVQFERAARPFVPDPSWPARRWLYTVYYAEREFRQSRGRWSSILAELGAPAPGADLTDPRVETTGELFEASVTLARPGTSPERWHVRQDGRVWKR